MSEHLQDQIRQRLGELEMSAREASLSAGLSASFVDNILQGKSKNPRSDNLAALAGVLALPIERLLGKQRVPASEVRPAPIEPADLGAMPKDIPVLGTAAGAAVTRGAFRISDDPVDWVLRPPGLARVRGAYGLFVEGDSMSPKFEPGELIYVNPHRPPKPGDAVVIQEPVPAGDGQDWVSYIKIFQRRMPQWIVTLQYNPSGEVRFRNSEAIRMHKVMSMAELFGI